jgi:hypothetical protein
LLNRARPWQNESMADYKIIPGRRAGDGWLVVIQAPGEKMDVLRSFETWAEARAKAERLAAACGAAGAPAADTAQPVAPKPYCQ